MNDYDGLLIKIRQIQELLAEVVNELEARSNDLPSEVTKARRTEDLPSTEQMIAEYEDLYKEFLLGNAGEVVRRLKDRTKPYLAAFCKANNLSSDLARLSKDQTIEGILQSMAQRQAIMKRAT